MDIGFRSIEELYRRVKPALTTKMREIHRNGISYIKEEDIWNYLKDKKWRSSKDLSLHQMVSDILNCDDILVDDHFKNTLSKNERFANLNSID